MNYLAHIHLSGEDPDLLVGNFIADGLRSIPLDTFSKEVQRGILLHRVIDEFTDKHHVFRQSKDRLFDKYRHYSGVLVDMFYDHFLAVHWNDFCEIPLKEYSQLRYDLLESRRDELPDHAKRFLIYIQKHNTLFKYQFLEDFEVNLNHLNIRVKYNYSFKDAIGDLKDSYEDFRSDFLSFYPELQSYIGNYLINNDKL